MWASQDKGILQERCDATTVLLPLRSCTWFQTMLSNSWDDIVLTGLLIETTFTQVPNIHRSFVAWTGIEQCMPTTCVVPAAPRPLCPRPPEAHSGRRVSGKILLRRHAAPLGGARWPRRGCRAPAVKRCRRGRQDERWPGASIREAGRDIESPWLGAIQQNVGNSDHKWHVNELMNDQNAICHIDINVGKVVSFHSWKRNMSGTMITM